MINGAKKRLLVVATTLALTASSAFAFTAPASATPPGNAADSRALPGALNDLSSQHDSGRDAPVGQVPAFSVSASQQMHGRVGGQALVDVNISRRKGDGVAASNLKVRLSGPSGFTVLSAAEFTPRHGTADATDWTCVPVNSNRDQDCTYTATSGNLASGVVPDPIRARIGIADNVSASTARIEAKATWTEDKVAPGSTGNAGDPVVGTRNQELTDGTDITVDGSLSVTLEGLTGDVVHVPATGGSDEDRTGHLVGKIGHINGRDASATWSQVSGPSVTFKRPTNVAQPADSTSQEYVVPAGTPDGTELVFGLDASSTGEHVSDTKTVTVRTHSPGTFDARTNLVAALAAATTQTPNSPKHGIKLRKADYKAAIAGKGVKHVTVTKKSAKKLKKLTLKFVHAAGVKSIKWKSIAGRAGILKKATKKKNAITIRVPKKKGTWLIRASVVLKNGHRISRTEVLKVDPIRPKVKVKKRALDLRVATADAASTQTFCNIGAGATLQFADGSSLTLPSSYQTPSPCTSTSKQSFTGATFSYNGTTFGSANGSLAGSTVKLSSVTFELPAKIASALPAGVPTSFTVSPPTSTPVTAKQSKGAWGAWTGTFSVPWLSFVPVPAGWSSPSGSLTLEPTTSAGKVTGARLSLTQESAATDGSGGSVSFDLTLSTAGPSDVQVNAANIALFQTSGGDQIEFSGRGTFFLSKGQSNSITFTMNCSAPDAAGDCPLSSGFALSKNTSLTWTQGQGISLAGAQATVGSGANAYTFNLAGAYTGVGNWSLSVNNSGTPWAIGSTGVTLSNFTGAVSEKPSGSDSELSVDIGATVNNLAVGNELTVSSMTANVSNQCAEGVSGCTPGNVTVAIAVAAQANLFNDTIDFNATANLNLSTMQFEFDASETAIVDFGPAALNITSATLTLTNQTLTGSCQPAGGGSPPAGGVLSLGISATGTAYGQPIDIGGDVNGDGYCLWAALGDYSTGVFNGDNIVLAYSSYAGGADLTLPANAGDTNAASPDTNTMTVNVPAGAIELTGGFVIPADASASLGLPAGTSTFTAQADVNLSSFIADVDYQLSTPVFIGGGSSTGSTAVTISAIQLKIGLTSGPMQASLALIVDGDVVVASNNGDCGADSAGASGDCSYTPVDGSIGVTLGTGVCPSTSRWASTPQMVR